jgi:hypothetical protein
MPAGGGPASGVPLRAWVAGMDIFSARPGSVSSARGIVSLEAIGEILLPRLPDAE